MIGLIFRNNKKRLFFYRLNRLKGPAAIFSDGSIYYYIDNQSYNKKEYYEKIKKLNININIK